MLFALNWHVRVKQPKDFIEYLGGKNAVRRELVKSIQSGSSKMFEEMERFTTSGRVVHVLWMLL